MRTDEEKGEGTEKKEGRKRRRRKKNKGGIAVLRGFTSESMTLYRSSWAPGTTFNACAQQSLLLRGVVPFLWRSRSGPLFRKEDPLHPFYSAQCFRHSVCPFDSRMNRSSKRTAS